jgi:hypothetical protein
VNQHGVPDEKLQQMKNRFEISLWKIDFKLNTWYL